MRTTHPAPHRSLAALLAAAACALAPAVARGQQCDGGGTDPSLAGTLRGTFPSDQARNVPTDGVVRLRYFVEPPTPATICVRRQADTECMPGRAAVSGDELVWQADERLGQDPLDPNTDYVVTFAESTGGTNRLTFRTGRVRSTAPPSFGGVSSVSARNASGDPCDPNAVDITVRFNRVATPIWPDSDIEYITYITRGPGVGGPREADRTRLQGSGFGSDRTAQRTFRLSGNDTAGPVCFNIQAVDPLGRADGNTAERCVNPAVGNNFVGCGASPGARSPWAPAGAGVALAFALSRRRPRRAPPRGASRGDRSA